MISNAVTAPLFDPHFQKKGLHIILKSFLRKAIVYYTHGALKTGQNHDNHNKKYYS
ncbi:MAG: hypothetical protein QG618_155 [Thermodesulfobacteriota bacterium]|nr:hypothetical protein [Thermodesulfobacteriota bacterium]